MMYRRRKPVHLILDSLPAHKRTIVAEYVASTEGRLTLHFLPGYAPDLNPDELVLSHVKSTGTARRPPKEGESYLSIPFERIMRESNPLWGVRSSRLPASSGLLPQII